MSHLKQNFSCFVRRLIIEQDGATATEYAVILGVIIVAVVGAVALFGLQFSSTTSAVYTGLSSGTDSAAGSFGPGSYRSQTGVTLP